MSEKALKIIEALGRHKDEESIDILRDLGTNSEREDVREETISALIRKNSDKAYRILVANEGKGINDLSTKVALSAVGKLVQLQDKEELLRVLDETINGDYAEEIKTTARSMKALITLSE